MLKSKMVVLQKEIMKLEKQQMEKKFEKQYLHLVENEEIPIYKLMYELNNIMNSKLVDLENAIDELKQNIEIEKEKNLKLYQDIENEKRQNFLLNNDIASLHNDIEEFKHYQKEQNDLMMKKTNTTPSKNHQYLQPRKISDELAKFLGKPGGTKMNRPDVTREIHMYIRAYNLQDKKNSKIINPDTKLAALLNLKNTDELTYYNLQLYISQIVY